MKRAKLLLLLACLLIALPATAAAYEPTNAIALDGTDYGIKITAKEEVTSTRAGENVALPAVPIPSENMPGTTNDFLIECVYTKYGWLVELEVDRVSSRFT